MATNFADVQAFHAKFGVPMAQTPTMLEPDDFNFRYKFLKEELAEFLLAWTMQDLAKMADALIDLVYVAMGTAVWMGLPWQLLWNEVQAANMSKEQAADASQSLELTGRGHRFDIVKPADFLPPRIEQFLLAWEEFQKTGDPKPIQRLQASRRYWEAETSVNALPPENI